MRNLMRLFFYKLQRNHSWIFIGFETFLVGVYFIAVPGSIHGISPWKMSFGFMDDWWPALVWIVLGMFMIINNVFDVVPDYNRETAYCMAFLWGFYFTLMIMRDLNDPRPPVIGLATVFYGVIMLRIITLLRYDDPTQHRRGGTKK
ncbi:hypothetical protein [Lacticaseibacillus hulanensis]|uniref:hypothetical protein n=1 Tax=Lacticaseibacillus hulanensis TaxID=2493111 RepID=UPI000FDB84A3|nr:hypothetical protein [Lacticaseibacillus hulanensis]